MINLSFLIITLVIGDNLIIISNDNANIDQIEEWYRIEKLTNSGEQSMEPMANSWKTKRY